MRFLWFLFYSLSSIILCGQDLHIYYDASRDSLYYIQNGEPTFNPSIRKGNPIKLHVINYNDYLYDLSIQLEEKDISIPSSGGGQLFQAGNKNLLSQLLSTAGQSGGTSGASQENVDWLNNSTESSGLNFAGTETVASSKAYQRLSTTFTSTLKSVVQKEQRINKQAKDIEANISVFALNQSLSEEILQLKYNPNLNPEQIKRLSLDYLDRVFDGQDPEDLDLDQVVRRADVKTKLQEQIKTYQRLIRELEQQLLILGLAKDSLIQYPYPSTAEKLSLSQTYDQVQLNASHFKNQVASLEEQAAGLKNWELKDLMQVRYAYEELKKHPFAYTYTFTPKQDEVKLNISLTPNDSAQVRNVKKRDLAPLEFPVYGGIKVNASVGISFGGYFDRPQSYFSRDGKIRANDSDRFLPIVTSFIHFYRQGRSSVSVGGSFGLGIAIGGETNGQHFFLGPSLVFGKTQRVVLTTGLMGGRVNRLSQDYAVGDLFDETIVPTKSVYDLGYFLGFSFNL